MIRKLLVVTPLLLSGTIAVSPAEEPLVPVTLGGVSLSLPAPDSFVHVGGISKEANELMSRFTPPENRYLAGFVSSDDAASIASGRTPRFDRYMTVQVVREIESTPIGENEFQQLAALTKRQMAQILSKVKDQANLQFDKIIEDLSQESGGSGARLQLREPVPVGVFLESKNAIGFAVLAPFDASEGGAKSDFVMASGTIMLNVGGRVFNAYVFGVYNSPQDLKWVQETGKAWTQQILAVNGVP